MTARPDEVVAWIEVTDTPYGEGLSFSDAANQPRGRYVQESALQSANARLAEVESEFGAFRQMAVGIVHRWIHDPKYSLDQCTNELLKLLDSGRAAAGEGDANQGDGE